MPCYCLQDLPLALRGAAVALGNFDGVHRGHAWVFRTARALGAPVIALTFEPHPRAVLYPQTAPFRLTSGDDKVQALAKAGADAVVTLRFDADLAALSAADFVDQILVGALAARYDIVGDDYRFGRGREGDAKLLAQMGRTRGFDLVTASAAKNGLGERFSSSRIRHHIEAGDMVEAGRLLGRAWSLCGEAVGDPQGGLRLDLGDHLRPRPGRYAVTLHQADALPAAGVAILEQGAASLRLQGIAHPGAVTVYLHQRLGDADQKPGLADGQAIGAHIFCVAE
jgi:riboflavin kinase/FMN adenylyltransferase